MSKLAIDVNIVLTWLGLQNESLWKKAIGIFGELVRGNLDVAAPDFLLVELVNVLKWRFKRSERETQDLIKRVMESGIKFVPIGVGEIGEVNKLMNKHELTAYDSLYLLVAKKMGYKLVTTDPKLLEVKEWCVGLEKLDL